MSDSASGGRRPTRRTVIVSLAIVVAVLLVVLFVVLGVSGRSPGSGQGAATGPATIKPSPTQTAGGFTPAPTATASVKPSGPVATPTGTAKPGTESPAIPLTGTATPLTGVHVKLTALTAVNGKGNGLGEIDGPAIRFSVVITNDTAKSLSLASVVTNVVHGSAQTPADELESVRKPFPQVVAKGATATATYTFTLAKTDRDDVKITVDYHVGVPITVFTGSAPR